MLRAPQWTMRPSRMRSARTSTDLRDSVTASLDRGVFGSPFVFVDGEPFWGLDRFDQIDRWLATGGF